MAANTVEKWRLVTPSDFDGLISVALPKAAGTCQAANEDAESVLGELIESLSADG
jgi:hypothetical protein